MKKEYKAPYFRPKFVAAIEPLMVSQDGHIKDTPDGFEGGFGDGEGEGD